MFRTLARWIGDLPWWALLLGGPAAMIAAGIYAAHTQSDKLVETAATPELRAAIRAEIKRAEDQAALDLGRAAIVRIQKISGNEELRAELDQALREIDDAERELRGARREVRDATRETERAVRDALREAESARREAAEAGPAAVREAEKALQQATREARAAGEAARREAEQAVQRASEELARARNEAKQKLEELNKLDAGKAPGDGEEKAAPEASGQSSAKPGHDPVVVVDMRGLREAFGGGAGAPSDQAPEVPAPPAAPLPSETDKDASQGDENGADPVKGVTIDLSIGSGHGVHIRKERADKLVRIDVGEPTKDLGVPPGTVLPELPQELRRRIDETVRSDISRVAWGSSLAVGLFLLWLLLIASKSVISVNRALKARAARSEAKAQEASLHEQLMQAKLAAMQAQIEPHFLFNTLASVDHLIETDPAAASKMQKNLIAYLRAAIPQMRESSTNLGREAELCRAYLNILQVRMESRLTFEIAIPDALKSVPIPPMMLPTLVENAIKHGLEPKPEGGSIRVSAAASAGKLRMSVADTGMGFSRTPGAGVGLANIRERLAALYNGRAALVMEPNSPQGTVATIEIPWSDAKA